MYEPAMAIVEHAAVLVGGRLLFADGAQGPARLWDTGACLAGHVGDAILASGKARDAPGMEGEKLMGQARSTGGKTVQSGAKKGSKGRTHTIPPERIKGVLVNGQIMSLDKYMKLLKPARPGKSRWRTE